MRRPSEVHRVRPVHAALRASRARKVIEAREALKVYADHGEHRASSVQQGHAA